MGRGWKGEPSTDDGVSGGAGSLDRQRDGLSAQIEHLRDATALMAGSSPALTEQQKRGQFQRLPTANSMSV
jgi:hypothetical protein